MDIDSGLLERKYKSKTMVLMVILCDLLDHPSALCGKSRRLFPRLKPSTKENGLKRNRIYGGAEMPSVHAHDYRLRFVCLNTV